MTQLTTARLTESKRVLAWDELLDQQRLVSGHASQPVPE
jgi:hypothetical protein